MLSSYVKSAEKLSQALAQEGIKEARVLEAIEKTPRHQFVDDILHHKAYQNTALPIGSGQTISQPLIVARMTELLLQFNVQDQVLEIGTGSGYQTAVLAQIFEHVYSVERIKALQWQARRRLQNLDLYNVSMKHGDGWQGWSTKGPFNGILVTAAPDSVPEQLLTQLADGGVLILPLGGNEQQLVVFKRKGDQFEQHFFEAVKFVPLVPGELA